MAGPLPESYRRLGQFAARFQPGDVIYEQGSVPSQCWVVLKGQIDFEVVGEDGEPQTVGSAHPGEPLGHVAFFTRHHTSALARAAEESVLLGFTREDLVQAVSLAPELAILLIEWFAGVRSAQREEQPATAPAPAADAAPEDDEAADARADRDDGVVRLEGEYDDTMFFVDTATCPVSGSRFEYIRVRTSAVRPMQRDTDFHVTYRNLNPTHYAIVVCPRCGYAASQDDFGEVGQEERIELWATRRPRIGRLGGRLLNGPRTTEDALVALELAISCYELRRTNERRRAVLLHRRAWVERERDHPEGEQQYLRLARDAYQAAYEHDTDISEDAAMRAAYLIGDLTLRLGDAVGGARWLETATRYPQAKTQTGLARMARERLLDARNLLAEQSDARQAG